MMKIVDFKREQGTKDIYEFFEELNEGHELKYYNVPRNPEMAAFGFINSLVIRKVESDADMQTYTRYLVYTFTLENPGEAKALYEGFEELLNKRMQDVECVYYSDGDKFIAVFNRIDKSMPPKAFVENYELTLRNIVTNATS